MQGLTNLSVSSTILGFGVLVTVVFIVIVISRKGLTLKQKDGDTVIFGTSESPAMTKLDEIMSKLKCIEIDTLRLQIYCTEMSLRDRDAAYQKYSARNQNGDTKAYYLKKIYPLIEKQYDE